MADNDSIRFLGDLQRLELKPGDRFVLQCETPISPSVRERIREVWKDFAGADAKLLILDGSMKLGVINTKATEDA